MFRLPGERAFGIEAALDDSQRVLARNREHRRAARAISRIEHERRGQFARDDNIVFMHTGGAVSLFGYVHAFAPRLGLA